MDAGSSTLDAGECLLIACTFVCRDLIGMRAPPVPLRGGKLPEFGSVDPWDGKDGEVTREKRLRRRRDDLGFFSFFRVA